MKVGGKIHKATVPGSHRYDDNVNLISKIIVESL
jgi:hypothetical protein